MYAFVCALHKFLRYTVYQLVFSIFSLSRQITFVDFIMYELLDQHRMFHPSCLDDFANLKDLLKKFEASTCERYKQEKCLFLLSVSGSPFVAVQGELV